MSAADLPDVEAREAFQFREHRFANVLPDRGVAEELGDRYRNVIDDSLGHLLVTQQRRHEVGEAVDSEELDQLTQPADQRGAGVTAEVVAIALTQRMQQQVCLELLELAAGGSFQSHLSSSFSRWSMSTGFAR